jgi:hypothetical protein
MKTQFEALSWAYIQNACAIYFDNKYLLSVPVNSSATNNQVWIFYPALQCWRVRDDWNVGAWATMKVGGEPRLYYIDSTDGSVHRAFYGKDDNGSVITSTLTGRAEDFGDAGRYKVGGEVEVSVLTVNDTSSFNVYASFDGQGFLLLGILDAASGTSPTLPVDLPFTLADNYTLYKKFHLEGLSRFRTIQIKIEDTIDSSSDIVMYGYTIRTFVEEIENE